MWGGGVFLGGVGGVREINFDLKVKTGSFLKALGDG